MAAPEIAVAYVSIVPEIQGFTRELREQITGPAQDAGADAGQQMGTSLRDKLKAGAAVAAVAAGAVIAKGLTDAIDQANIKNRLQAQLGATGKDAAKYGAIAGKLYTKGVTENFEEGAEVIRAIMNAGIAPPGATNKQLQSIATQVADVSKTFGTDLSMQTQAVAAMMKNNLAPSATDALNVITVGMQKLGPNAEDLLETFQEYSVQMAKLGVDSKMALGLFQQGLQGGARDTDILADALKEFSIRSIDMSDSSRQAYKDLGLSAAQMEAMIGKGGDSAAKGLDIVLDKLRGMSDPVEREAAAVGLFGTQAEDLGKALFALDPSKAVAAVGSVGGAAEKMGKVLRSGPTHELEVFQRRLQQGLTEAMAKYAIPALTSVGHAVNTYFIPAMKGGVSVAQDVFGFLRDAAPWLVPLGVAIGGVTIALNAQAIATGVVTAVFAVYRGAIIAGTVVTNGFAAAQAVLNAVMALNPFVLVAIALAALVAGLVLAYKRSETFRAIVQTALQAVGAAFSWLWDTVLKPIFGFLDTAFRILLTLITVVVVGPIILALKLLGALFGWLWSSAIKPAIDAIGAAAQWLWKNVFSPVFGWIGDKAKWLYNNAIKPHFNLIKAIIKVVGDSVKWFWDKVVSPVFGWISDKAKWLWDKGVKPAFDGLKKGVKAVSDSFGKAKDAIKTQWDKLEGIAKKPVEFIVNTVYSKGIVPVWNKVASAFGAPKLKAMKFATGGILPGYTPGRDVHLAALSGGEAVMRPEWTRAVGPGYVNSMNALARKGGVSAVQKATNGGLPAFANGGIFNWIGNQLQGAGSAAWNGIKKGASWLGDTLESSARAGVKHVVDPLLKRIPGSSTMFGKAIRGIPNKMIDSIFGYSKEADRKVEASGIGGKGTRQALAWARTQAGKPYQWAGAGNPSWDCSGFMAGIQKKIMGKNPNGRLWSTFAFNGSTAPAGWVRGMKAPFMVGITNAGVGHTAGTLNGVNVESRGGDGVVVGKSARGYRDSLFTDWYGFEPSKKYDSGGWLQPGATMAVNKTGKPEPILTASQWASVATLAERGMSGGLQPGDTLILTIDGRTELEAYVDRRADQRIESGLSRPAILGRSM